MALCEIQEVVLLLYSVPFIQNKRFAKVLEGEGEGVYAYVSGVCVYVGVGRRPMRSSVILFVNYFFHFFCVLLI